MLKKVTFKLSQIKYKGKSIGDDIQVAIQVDGESLFVDSKIKKGTTKIFNEEIGAFVTSQSNFMADVKITIVEEDIRFNDVADVIKTLKFDLSNQKTQKFVYEIKLQENRYFKNWGKSVAIFEVTLEASVGEAIQYIPDINNGWLLVRIFRGKEVSLPAFLKVKSLEHKQGREYFEILEGHYRGKTASVKLDGNKSRLLPSVQHEKEVHFKYSISKKQLIIGKNKKDRYDATDDINSPWKKGFYDIEMPDYPHRDFGNYVNISSRFKTWFRIGHGGKRYLHTGRVSGGCITITEIEKWNEIYNKLIKARKGDFVSVGILEVID